MQIKVMGRSDVPRLQEYLASTRENRALGAFDTVAALTRALGAGAGFLAMEDDTVVGSMLVEMGMFGVIRREHARDDEVFDALLAKVEEACREAGITRIQNLADDGTRQREQMMARGFTTVGGA